MVSLRRSSSPSSHSPLYSHYRTAQVGEYILDSFTYANRCTAQIFSVLYSTLEQILLQARVKSFVPRNARVLQVHRYAGSHHLCICTSLLSPRRRVCSYSIYYLNIADLFVVTCALHPTV